MNLQARERYWTDQVTTAPPQKLFLMLLEGAIRFIHKAQGHWAAKEDELALQALIRAQEIVGEILSGFKRDLDPELVSRVAGVYGFVLRSLVEGSMLHDAAKLADALRILEIERDTWRELCQKIGTEQTGFASSVPPPQSPIPSKAFDAIPSGQSHLPFSLEA
jgi:flagellar protein FliS